MGSLPGLQSEGKRPFRRAVFLESRMKMKLRRKTVHKSLFNKVRVSMATCPGLRTTEAGDALLPWKPHPKAPLYRSLFAFADEVLRVWARPSGSFRETGVGKKVGKRGRREGRWRERERGARRKEESPGGP